MVGRRMRGPTAATVWIAMAVLLAGCQWMSSGWDASGSADNTVDTQVGIGNVAGLHLDWRADPGTGQDAGVTPVATGNTLISVARFAAVAELDAYSANGTAGCSGSPRTCVPLWHATGTSFSQPLAVDGVVYVDNSGVLDAYDASGVRNCSGTPAVCLPLWSGTGAGGHPIFEDGRVYVAGSDEIDAYATDASGCSGTPVVCHPVATYRTHDLCSAASCPVVALVADHDRLYASVVFASTITIPFPGGPVQEPTITQSVAAYDLGGGGSPAFQQQYNYELGQAPAASGLMDVGGQIYATGSNAPLLSNWSPFVGIKAFTPYGVTSWQSRGLLGIPAAAPDAIFAAGGPGIVACAPAVGCGAVSSSDPLAPLRSYDAGTHGVTTGIALANGVLYAGGNDALLAFDESGHVGCTGTPAICQPVGVVPLASGARELSITNGRVVVTTASGQLIAYTAT